MINRIGVPYRVLLPDWVFLAAYSEEEIIENARKYLKKCYPERVLIEVEIIAEKRFAVCEMRN